MKCFDNSHVSNHSCDNGHDVTAAAPVSWGICVWMYDVNVYNRSRIVQMQTTWPTKLTFLLSYRCFCYCRTIPCFGFWLFSFIKRKPNANCISDTLKHFLEGVDFVKTRNQSRNASDHSSFFTFSTETMHKL